MDTGLLRPTIAPFGEIAERSARGSEGARAAGALAASLSSELAAIFGGPGLLLGRCKNRARSRSKAKPPTRPNY